MKPTLILIILSILLASCSLMPGSENEEIPENIIPREKMIVVLADMQITEAYLQNLRKAGFKVKDTSVLYYKMVFKKNDITNTSFEESLLYYQQDLAKLELIYTDVITRLNELKAKNEEMLLEMKNDSIRQDSIAKALIIKDSLDKVAHIEDSIRLLNDTTTHTVSDTLL